MRSTWTERFAFLGLMAVAFAWAAVEAHGFPSRARLFPQTVALLALVLVIPAAVRSLRESRTKGAGENHDKDEGKGGGPGESRIKGPVPSPDSSVAPGSRGVPEEPIRDAPLGDPLPGSARRQWILALPYLAAMGAHLVLIALIGFLPASFLFIALFVFRFGGLSWWRSIAVAAVFTLALFGLTKSLGLTLPGGEWISRR